MCTTHSILHVFVPEICRTVLPGSIMVGEMIGKVAGIMREACRDVPLGYMYHVRKNAVKGLMLSQTGDHMWELILVLHDVLQWGIGSSKVFVLCFTYCVWDSDATVLLMNHSPCQF